MADDDAYKLASIIMHSCDSQADIRRLEWANRGHPDFCEAKIPVACEHA